MKKLYVVRLSEEERSELTKLVKTGRAPAYRRRHAEILLQADQGQHGPALHDRQIVDKLDVARQTGIIARFVSRITLSRVRLRSLGCADPHITCPRNMAARFETVWSMETNKGAVRKPETGRKLCLWHRPQSDR